MKSRSKKSRSRYLATKQKPAWLSYLQIYWTQPPTRFERTLFPPPSISTLREDCFRQLPSQILQGQRAKPFWTTKAKRSCNKRQNTFCSAPTALGADL